MDLLKLGNIIREKRNQQHISQEYLSNKSVVAIKTIHSIELGKANPSIKTLNKLLDLLELELIIVSKKS